MTTLKDILNLMCYSICDFSADAFIQVIDTQTQAHYRKINGHIYLGGDYVCHDERILFRRPVTCIEYIDDHCVISLA